MPLDESSVWKYVTEAAVVLVGALSTLVWRGHTDKIRSLEGAVKDAARETVRADTYAAEIHVIRKDLADKVELSTFLDANDRADRARSEMLAGVTKLFDRLEEHADYAQKSYNGLRADIHANHVALLTALNSKQDK